MFNRPFHLTQIRPVIPPMFRRVAVRHKVHMAIGDIDRALALLSHLEPGDSNTENHPDVVQARAYLAKALRQLGGRS